MISTIDYAATLAKLGRVARRYYPADPVALAADVIADLGPDADYVLLCRAIQDKARDMRRSDVSRAKRERAVGLARGTTYIGETDADSVEPIDYLSYISDPTTRDIVFRSIRGESQATIAESLGTSRQTVSRLYLQGIEEIRESFGIREQIA